MTQPSIVIWMNQPSHYQTAFFRELHAQNGGRLAVIYDADLASDRRALGWQSVRQEQYPQHFLQGWLDAVVQAWNHRDAVHMVNGLWSVKRFLPAALLLLLNGSQVYFHAECPDPERPPRRCIGALKRLWIGWVFIWSAGIFVIGKRAGQHYRAMGVPARKIVPFLYCTEVVPNVTHMDSSSGAPRVLYVGQFVARKNVETLLRAFALLRAGLPDWRLRLVGAGPLRGRYEQLGGELALGDSLELFGPSSPAEIMNHMMDSSLVVLPSRFDGWGLVVNEALQSGVPVICSEGCGASELLEENPHWGAVFPSDRVDLLAAALREMLVNRRGSRPLHAHVEKRIGKVTTTERFLNRVVRDLHYARRRLCV